jgi:hypothetical protein
MDLGSLPRQIPEPVHPLCTGPGTAFLHCFCVDQEVTGLPSIYRLVSWAAAGRAQPPITSY